MSAATSAAIGLAELALGDGDRSAKALAERPDAGNARFREALAHIGAPPSDVLLLYRIGSAWARGGQPAEAAATLKRMDEVAPEHSRQFDALKALLRAEIALGASNASDAVKEAEAGVGFDRPPPADMLRAYIAAHRPPTPSARSSTPVAARRTLRLARLARLLSHHRGERHAVKDDTGDRGGAAPHLKKFVATWSAVPGQPMVEDAKRRLAAQP